MPGSHTIYRPCPGVTPEEARTLRACAWAYIFDCHAKKKGGPETAPEDAERRSNGIGADEASIPRRAD